MGTHLWLIGMMGAGKSTVGRLVAARAAVPFVDTDDRVEARAGRDIARIFADDGEAAFRALERSAVSAMASESRAVVATGGGVVLHDGNVTAMRDTGIVVWLVAGAETLAARIGDGTARPLLDGGDTSACLDEILAHREAHYRAAAHAAVATEGVEPDAVADSVEALWRGI